MLGFGPGGLEISFDLGHDLRMIGGNVPGLADVRFQVVQLEGLAESEADGFEVARSDRLLGTPFVELPVAELVAPLLSTQQRRHHGDHDRRRRDQLPCHGPAL